MSKFKIDALHRNFMRERNFRIINRRSDIRKDTFTKAFWHFSFVALLTMALFLSEALWFQSLLGVVILILIWLSAICLKETNEFRRIKNTEDIGEAIDIYRDLHGDDMPAPSPPSHADRLSQRILLGKVLAFIVLGYFFHPIYYVLSSAFALFIFSGAVRGVYDLKAFSNLVEMIEKAEGDRLMGGVAEAAAEKEKPSVRKSAKALLERRLREKRQKS